jgi:Uma2 family endonuclease
MATTKLWTVEELEQLPDDEYRYALIKGELYRMPPPMGPHGLVVSTIVWYVYSFVRKHRLGRVYDQSGFILERNPDTVLGPDQAFVSSARLPADLRGYPELAPDLVVEVASPSQSGPSIVEKAALYLEVGVRLVWIVDPVQRTVHVRHAEGGDRILTEHDAIEGEDVLPGFRLPISQLFEEAFG